MQIEVLASAGQAGAVGDERDLAEHLGAKVVQHAVLAAHVERRAALPARQLGVLVGGHQYLPPVGRSAGDGRLVVLRHVDRMRHWACQFAYN